MGETADVEAAFVDLGLAVSTREEQPVGGIAGSRASRQMFTAAGKFTEDGKSFVPQRDWAVGGY